MQKLLRETRRRQRWLEKQKNRPFKNVCHNNMKEMIWFIFVCALPSIWEAWTDRHGENRNQKVKDALILIGCACCLSLLAKMVLSVSVLKTVALLLAWRVSWFDYMVHAFLKHYSESHKGINIWTYSGKTTHFWDQWISKVHPAVRFVLRLLIFLGALFYFFYTP